MEEEEGKHGDTEDTERRAPGHTIREMREIPYPKQPGSLREIHYRNSQDLPLRLCVFAPLRLLLLLASN